MPLNDEQFERLMKNLDMRDMLIRIDENTKNMGKNFDEHKKDDASASALVGQSLAKVHVRIDGVGIEMASIKNRIIGGFFVATLLASAITWGLNVYNQGRMYQDAVKAIGSVEVRRLSENTLHNS